MITPGRPNMKITKDYNEESLLSAESRFDAIASQNVKS